MWGWNVICAPDIFTWNFLFVLLNMGQVLHIIYQMRPVKFNSELEDLYNTLFEPLRVRGWRTSGEERAGRDRTGRDGTGQTEQDGTGQDRTEQDRTE